MAVQPRVVFRAAAGPRVGYGHLVRTTVLSQALGLPAELSLRGAAAARRVARSLGWTPAAGPAGSILGAAAPSLLLIDDPSARDAQRWRRAAARRGIPVASVTDLGLVSCDADLTIDGSIGRTADATSGAALRGLQYLVLAPTAAVWREPDEPIVLIALGGGPRRRAALALARRILAAHPGVRVRIAGGLAAGAPVRSTTRVSWLGPRKGLASDLAAATVAVVGGGLSAYDACRVGTPAVAVAVVAAQRPTIVGLAAAGAVLDGGHLRQQARVARQVATLLGDRSRRARMSRSGRRLIDGRGADRVAVQLRRLIRDGAAGIRKDVSS